MCTCFITAACRVRQEGNVFTGVFPFTWEYPLVLLLVLSEVQSQILSRRLGVPLLLCLVLSRSCLRGRGTPSPVTRGVPPWSCYAKGNTPLAVVLEDFIVNMTEHQVHLVAVKNGHLPSCFRTNYLFKIIFTCFYA